MEFFKVIFCAFFLVKRRETFEKFDAKFTRPLPSELNS